MASFFTFSTSPASTSFLSPRFLTVSSALTAAAGSSIPSKATSLSFASFSSRRYLRDTLAEAGYAPVVTGEHEALARIIAAEKPRLVLLTSCSPAPTASS